MAEILESNDDDSFIILGTSPGTSINIKCHEDFALTNNQQDNVPLTNGAFKAHFHNTDSPTLASLMVASTIITEDNSMGNLQKRFGELLDENNVLKDTLEQNNASIKEQMLLISSCQEDMLKTHLVHKEKFDETRMLVERLREENKNLKTDIEKLAESANGGSAVEFITSPEDDVVDKLTGQLALVEAQRREVIVHNEKLTWQKESLERIVDATTKERDEIKEKFKNLELQLEEKQTAHKSERMKLQMNIQEMNQQMQTTNSLNSLSSEELMKRDAIIKHLEDKVSALQGDLKKSQLKILELENVKLDYTKHMSSTNDVAKLYKDQIQELNTKLKEIQTTVFQPVRLSISSEPESTTSEHASLLANIKLYDRTLKHLAQLLNSLTHGTTDNLIQTLGLISSLHDYKLEKSTCEQFRLGLVEVKRHLEKQHKDSLDHVSQVKGTLTIFEKMFKDYSDFLKNEVVKTAPKPAVEVEALTSALLARGNEIQTLKTDLIKLQCEREEIGVLRAQLELYKSDFDSERKSREEMASSKESILVDLRNTQRKNQELVQQLESLQKQVPNTSSPVKRTRPLLVTSSNQPTAASGPPSNVTTGNLVRKKKKVNTKDKDAEENCREHTPPPLRFVCPVCDESYKTLILLQQHIDNCLNANND